jgi:hypothetical protein
MSTIGASELLESFGSPLGVAEALLRGDVPSHRQQYVSELVSPIVLQAAHYRMQTAFLRSVLRHWGIVPASDVLGADYHSSPAKR